MKKIKLIVTFLAVTLLVPSCQDDGGDSKLEVSQGAIADVQKDNSTDSFIDLIAINEGASINIGFTVDKKLGDVTSMDVVAFYIKSSGETSKGVLFTNVTTFPATFNITQEDLYTAFDVLNVPSDFEVGDQLIITTDLTLSNGNVVNTINDEGIPNYGSNLSTPPFSPVQSYNVACPSDLAGTYEFSTSNIGEPDGGFVAGPVTGTVTFAPKGGGVYDISDGSFGGWEALYGPGDATGVTLIDICNQIKFGGADDFGDTYTMTNLVVTGNQISFHWENTYGEFGDTTLTRTDGTDWPPLTL